MYIPPAAVSTTQQQSSSSTIEQQNSLTSTPQPHDQNASQRPRHGSLRPPGRILPRRMGRRLQQHHHDGLRHLVRAGPLRLDARRHQEAGPGKVDHGRFFGRLTRITRTASARLSRRCPGGAQEEHGTGGAFRPYGKSTGFGDPISIQTVDVVTAAKAAKACVELGARARQVHSHPHINLRASIHPSTILLSFPTTPPPPSPFSYRTEVVRSDGTATEESDARG
ncbi:hypothetical protein IWZ03DRAFT_150366 [Phyllosticta citriasiana]|uniref:Uncharacterized protein n=1 Tax=Phyllosticta citriasiana TaxID=595635 RepID=A0ABR1KTK6_9PEZI